MNQIALASQMHIHGKRMADYTGFVAPRLPAEGCFASLGKGVPGAYLSRQNDVVNARYIVPLAFRYLCPTCSRSSYDFQVYTFLHLSPLLVLPEVSSSDAIRAPTDGIRSTREIERSS